VLVTPVNTLREVWTQVRKEQGGGRRKGREMEGGGRREEERGGGKRREEQEGTRRGGGGKGPSEEGSRSNKFEGHQREGLLLECPSGGEREKEGGRR
jgi:hypothetical protein